MGLKELKKIGWAVRNLLILNKISPAIIILYGSHARNSQRPDSDIDLAIISENFGQDRLEEGIEVNLLTSKIDSRIEAVPFSVEEYLDATNPNPLLAQIKATGIPLF